MIASKIWATSIGAKPDRRLVDQQQLRPQHQRHAEGEHLPLAADKAPAVWVRRSRRIGNALSVLLDRPASIWRRACSRPCAGSRTP
jgi:hypothetical protein